VINDGSHDQTLRLLQVMFQLRRDHKNPKLFTSITFPELRVIEAPHLGKAQALNFGVAIAHHQLICTMDADTIPDARGVETCLRAFGKDQKLIAVGGVIQVLNSTVIKNNLPDTTAPKGWLSTFQRIEYLRAFVCERLGWSLLRSTVLISGAFCMIKKDAVEKVGGFSGKSITEDLDLILRLRSFYKDQKNSFQILPVTTCYTQVPSTMGHLAAQRIRWQRGLVQTLCQYPKLVFHPAHGLFGLLAIPYMWIVEVCSPVVEGVAAFVVPYSLYKGWISFEAALFFFAVGIVFNVFLTLFGTYLDNKYVSRGRNWKAIPSILQTVAIHFGYKQLNSWWRFVGLIKSARAGRWGGNPREEITVELAS
jgi:cellulose synthase/poly-beta-1,6-N-acetylglucosamine synthase-like glycosyltransferase